MDHAAPAQLDDAGINRAMADSTAFRLEFYRLSRRHLVFQSVLLAGAVRVRFVVRTRRRTEIDGDHQFADHVVRVRRLSRIRTDHDHGRPVSGFRGAVPALALCNLQSQRQDLSRALSLRPFRRHRHHGDPLHSEGLASAGMEGVRSADRLRSAIARRVLRRRVPLLCRAL